MALIGLTLDSSKEYQSEYDKGKGTDNATVFVLGTLDSRIFGKIRDLSTTISVNSGSRLSDDAQTTINSNEVAFNTVMYGLRDWKNFKDVKGNEIKFETIDKYHGGVLYKAVSPDLMKLLPHPIILELAEQIRAANELTEEEAKN